MRHARAVWQVIESIHAVTYFADESKQAAIDAGLKGFWMGYFGFRAAPLGQATPGLVDATFANFDPTMVRRSVPDVWEYADPQTLLEARASGAAAALRRVIPTIDDIALDTNESFATTIESGSSLGRPLYAANRELHTQFDDPVERLWQLTTAFREHRGDGHLMALAHANIDGCEAHLLAAASAEIDQAVFQSSRGWNDEAWSAAAARLQDRGVLDGAQATPSGADLHQSIESQTDEMTLGVNEDLHQRLAPAALQIAASGEIPYPNPMGLPTPAS